MVLAQTLRQLAYKLGPLPTLALAGFGDTILSVHPADEMLELVTEWVPPGSRVLEVGCGNGRLALHLRNARYDVTAIDPRAPAGEIFRAVTLEDFAEPGPFDAVVARRSLHHVHDLARALDKIAGLLGEAGRLVLSEFAWDRMDHATARWYGERSGATLDDWRREHEDLHGHAAMSRELRARFEELHFQWTPYLARELGRPGDEDEERELIAAGRIRALGFIYVGAGRRQR